MQQWTNTFDMGTAKSKNVSFYNEAQNPAIAHLTTDDDLSQKKQGGGGGLFSNKALAETPAGTHYGSITPSERIPESAKAAPEEY
mmetsp:Transcript_35563/g.54357  ORF Transcript_35563/g.54357 Transcript_35563/m.54357 type:complete len:85 (+) Transcript_35563:215-469(+)